MSSSSSSTCFIFFDNFFSSVTFRPQAWILFVCLFVGICLMPIILIEKRKTNHAYMLYVYIYTDLCYYYVLLFLLVFKVGFFHSSSRPVSMCYFKHFNYFSKFGFYNWTFVSVGVCAHANILSLEKEILATWWISLIVLHLNTQSRAYYYTLSMLLSWLNWKEKEKNIYILLQKI